MVDKNNKIDLYFWEIENPNGNPEESLGIPIIPGWEGLMTQIFISI
jgi:hypothetical protein